MEKLTEKGGNKRRKRENKLLDIKKQQRDNWLRREDFLPITILRERIVYVNTGKLKQKIPPYKQQQRNTQLIKCKRSKNYRDKKAPLVT